MTDQQRDDPKRETSRTRALIAQGKALVDQTATIREEQFAAVRSLMRELAQMRSVLARIPGPTSTPPDPTNVLSFARERQKRHLDDSDPALTTAQVVTRVRDNVLDGLEQVQAADGPAGAHRLITELAVLIAQSMVALNGEGGLAILEMNIHANGMAALPKSASGHAVKQGLTST